MDLSHFTTRLIAESLFYDEEYGALGNLSLIDQSSGRESYIASFSPEDGMFVIERATRWEEDQPGANDEIGYLLAVDSSEFGSYDTADEVAAAMLTLASEHGLVPSITLLFEEDEVA